MNEKTKVEIEVSCYRDGRFVEDELLNEVKWQMQNIGGTFIDSSLHKSNIYADFPKPNMYYLAVFEFPSIEQPVFAPMRVIFKPKK